MGNTENPDDPTRQILDQLAEQLHIEVSTEAHDDAAPVILRRFHERELQIVSTVGWGLQLGILGLTIARILTKDKRYAKAATRLIIPRLAQGYYEYVLRQQLQDPLVDVTQRFATNTELAAKPFEYLAKIQERFGTPGTTLGAMPEPGDGSPGSLLEG